MPTHSFDCFDYLKICGIILIFLNIGLSFIGANMAKNKGYSFGGFWLLGFFSSFVFALILAWVLPSLYVFVKKEEYHHEHALAQESGRICARCGKPLRNDEVFCSQCGTKVE